ncbi:MAG: NADH-ubiquinone oxidoreductase-F iron-sulfur binding region domain-containing protein [Patescibacteria group bacterium]
MVTQKSIINSIKKANLCGRGGADFPVALKWQSVSDAVAKSGKKASIVVNCSEGEPGVFKDAYILENHLSDFFVGLRTAVDFLDLKKISGIYFFTSAEYAKEFMPFIEKELSKKENLLIKKIWHTSLKKGHSYISGEESALLNVIEFSLAEPRLKPPYPAEKGLFASPTLVNNLETFYDVGLVVSGKFKKERFYSITGETKNSGVYAFSKDATILEILKESGNLPKKDFFVVVGGDMSGEVLNSKQLKRPVGGAGSIRIYPGNESHRRIINEWLEFYVAETCGHCTPCREGTYRLLELFRANPTEFMQFKGEVRELIDNLSNTSFCALGSSLTIPLNSYAQNILKIKIKK